MLRLEKLLSSTINRTSDAPPNFQLNPLHNPPLYPSHDLLTPTDFLPHSLTFRRSHSPHLSLFSTSPSSASTPQYTHSHNATHIKMSEWDSVTRIGTKHRAGGTPRETVVKGKSALNAAQRQGLVIGTEKKYAAGNTVCLI